MTNNRPAEENAYLDAIAGNCEHGHPMTDAAFGGCFDCTKAEEDFAEQAGLQRSTTGATFAPFVEDELPLADNEVAELSDWMQGTCEHGVPNPVAYTGICATCTAAEQAEMARENRLLEADTRF